MDKKESTMYEDAVDLLERINSEMKDNKNLDTINIKMIGVVRDLNNVRIEKITGKEPDKQSDDQK